MALRELLKFRSLDQTRLINDRYSKLILPGVFDGGDITPVPLQLKVDVAPWKLASLDGMVVEETSAVVRLSTPAGQTTVISVKAQYLENANPIVETLATEITAWTALLDRDYHVVLGWVTVPLSATQVLSSYIDLRPRDVIDKIGRSAFRGTVTNAGLLPASNSVVGDFYIVVAPGDLPNVYAWNGSSWILMTDSVQVVADLAAHRQNLLIDEKHLTDDEKGAMVGTSGTPLSFTNPVVDDADTRIPTQDENDALVGSDGSPSSTNLYVTQDYPIGVPDELAFASAPVSPYVLAPTASGPYYVGKQVAPSANQYFSFYHYTAARELTTSTSVPVTVLAVYTDSGLTAELDPATSPSVDVDGFFTGDLYIKYSVTPTSALRLLYTKFNTLKTISTAALQRRSVRDAQTSAEAIRVIEKAKGRLFDDLTPVLESNYELRRSVINAKEFVSSVFNADFVVYDFARVQNVPEFAGNFVPNVGIPQSYSFSNGTAYTYNSITGTVTYSSPVSLVSVVPGHVFIDDNAVEFRVQSTGVNSVVIRDRIGNIPLTVVNTVVNAFSGSIKPDNNPRKTNLSVLDNILGRDRVNVRQLEVVHNEFHPSTENVAFAVRTPLRSLYYREPRLRMYGSFRNDRAGLQSRVLCTNAGRLLMTGFFTDLILLVDLLDSSPTISVYVDGVSAGGPIDLSRGGLVADPAVIPDDIHMEYVAVATNLSDGVPHTVEVVINNASGDFIFYGVDFIRYSSSDTTVLPGRAFVQSDLYKLDAITSPSTPAVALANRGQVVTRYINRTGSFVTATQALADLDGTTGTPSGVAVAATPNFSVLSGLAKFSNYRAGDIVKLVTASSEETKVIGSIPTPGNIVFTNNVIGSGSAVLYHVGSTSSGFSLDPNREYARYYPADFSIGNLGDFGLNFAVPGDKTYTLDDGTTSVSALNVQYVTTGIDGVDYALSLVGLSSTMRIRAVCCRMDILVADSTPTSAGYSVDGCPTFPITSAGSGLQRVRVFTNARYQTHEVLITNGTGLKFAGIILYEPTTQVPIEGTALSTQNQLARYQASTNLLGDAIPSGAVAIDPLTNGGIFINGTGTGTSWVGSLDFVQSPSFGKYISTSREGGTFEYSFIGQGLELEYSAGPDRGIPRLFLNTVLVTSTNFPGAVLSGLNTATGEVDMYSATVTRKRIAISGLTKARYTLTLVIPTPRSKNVSSTDYFINVTSVYELNSDGTFGVTPSQSVRQDFVFGLDSLRDERNFDSGAVAIEEVPVQRSVILPARAGRVTLSTSAESVNIVFTQPMTDMNFMVSAQFINLVDTNPLLQPIIISGISAAGFTARWNVSLPSGNYSLSYNAVVTT